jgi:hypothetical protein
MVRQSPQRLFQAIVLMGAALTSGAGACNSDNNSAPGQPDAGPGADARASNDASVADERTYADIYVDATIVDERTYADIYVDAIFERGGGPQDVHYADISCNCSEAGDAPDDADSPDISVVDGGFE